MQEILVSREESGQRLDKYLRRRLPLAPSSFIYKMLRKKNITLRGKKADGSEKVETGDSVKLFLSDETIAKFSRPQDDAEAKREADEDLEACKALAPLLGPSPVLYEDEHIVVVRKPAGVLSQKAEASDLSMNEWLRGYLAQRERGSKEEAAGTAVFKPSVCNRLDRNTGGILLCAKTLPGSRALSAVIRDRAIRKTYTMVVHGQISEPGIIENELIKDRANNQVRVAPKDKVRTGSADQNEQRRRAVTVYRPVRTGEKATMVEADLITGRSHQLRVHMASIGHPIVSDPRYGDKKLDGALLQRLQGGRSDGRVQQKDRINNRTKDWAKDRIKDPTKDRAKDWTKDRAIRSGQLLWCSEVAVPENIPDLAEDDGIRQVLAPLAGRVFKCPPPRWWADLCEDTKEPAVRRRRAAFREKG